MAEFSGVYPVVPTPFDQAGEVDTNGLRSIFQSQVDRGVDGVVCFGIAAEFYKLRDAERRDIVSVASEVCAGTDTDLVVSVTDHATVLAEEFAAYAEAEGADGLMLLPPHFLGPSEADLLSHMRRVGESVDLPIMVQYAPEQTGVTIAPEALIRVSDTVSTITAFKIESRPPGPYLTTLREKATENLRLCIGYGGMQMIEAFDRGADGVIPGASLSHRYQDIIKAWRNGQDDKALARHQALLPLLSFMIQDIEMFIHYEKRLLEVTDVLDEWYARDPSYSPDKYQDTHFEACYEAISREEWVK